MNQLIAAASVAHDGIIITEWKSKNLLHRLIIAYKFARRGKFYIVEKQIVSDKSIFIDNPL